MKLSKYTALLIATLALPMLAAAQNAPKKPASRETVSAVPAWPTRAVKLLVGFPGGSTPDMAARTLAEPLSRALGQPVIVEAQQAGEIRTALLGSGLPAVFQSPRRG